MRLWALSREQRRWIAAIKERAATDQHCFARIVAHYQCFRYCQCVPWNLRDHIRVRMPLQVTMAFDLSSFAHRTYHITRH